ncbi:MAG: hypothetical protein AB7G75_18295 [Candidatus Binatia bacterium]
MEKNSAINAFQRGLLGQAVREKLLADIDAQWLCLKFAATGESAAPQPSPDRADGQSFGEQLT